MTVGRISVARLLLLTISLFVDPTVGRVCAPAGERNDLVRQTVARLSTGGIHFFAD